MASVQHIIAVIAFSALIIVIIGLWTQRNHAEPEVLLSEDAELEGPLAQNVLKDANPDLTNTMNPTAVFKTNKGNIEIELFADLMPITTSNFITLAEDGFYDGIKFHRVIPNFMIQSGDPNSKGDDTMAYGTGGPGYTIQDEFVNDPLLSNVRGTIAMANTGQPNSGGSQFFINTVDNLGLDFNQEPLTSKHPVFGRVTKGMDVVDAISTAETGARDLPIDPIIIESVEIR